MKWPCPDQEVASLYYETPFFTADGLVASATSATQIDLNWNAVAGATAYNLKRSLTSGGPYTLLAGGLTTTNHVDTGLTAGVEYHYVVSAVHGGNESGDSAEASAMTTAPVGTSPVITTNALPDGTVGFWYQETLTATDGEGALTWSLVSGALPSGISLSSSGILSGTASTSGTANFSVKVTDADGDADTQALSLTHYDPGNIPATQFTLAAGDVTASDSKPPMRPPTRSTATSGRAGPRRAMGSGFAMILARRERCIRSRWPGSMGTAGCRPSTWKCLTTM